MNEAMSRYDRLERWASVLERSDPISLTPFRDVELLPLAARAGLRTANSPLARAWQDPVLRRAGLSSDRLGDGAAFFGLSRRQTHRVLCSCGYMGLMRPNEVARRIRAIAAREGSGRSWGSNPLPALARLLTQGWQPLAGQRG